jgi:hypothetical protein
LLRSALPSNLQSVDVAESLVRPSFHVVRPGMYHAQVQLFRQMLEDRAVSLEQYVNAVCRTVGVLADMETMIREERLVLQVQAISTHLARFSFRGGCENSSVEW